MALNEKTRRIILIVSVSIIFICIAWTILRGSDSELGRIASFLRECGYNVYEDDLLIAYDNADTTISDVLSEENTEDIEKAVEASKQGGFSSDIYKRGGVTLILAQSGDEIITLYIVNGEKELCFVQTESGDIKPIGDNK